MAEIINGTVHAFSLTAMEATAGGYRLYWAIYVKRVNRFTPLYMMMIDPFRRFLVYPAVIQGIKRAWASRYGYA